MKPSNDKAVFFAALDLSSPEERAAFVEATCAGDPAMRRRVAAMLEAHERTDRLLDRPAAAHLGDTPVATTDTPTDPADQEAEWRERLAPPTRPGSLGRMGHYEVLEVAGRGGMGVVYRARHVALKREVALKMVLVGGHIGPEHLARFRIEAEAVARLQHPNIVQIHEVGESGGRPYFAMEFVEGGSLAGKLAEGPMPAPEAARLAEALARAMHLAHSRNVVHRDLKPANVLLAADGTPKITDFGLARQTDTDSGETKAGAIMGTPSYMAPEQASGHAHEAGPVADVYALGAILYDCLAGRPPFKGDTALATIVMVRTQEPTPPSRWRAGVPPDLETICLKCLRKEPENRYASAAELADDLGRYQRGEPILARPVGRAERAVKWVRRNPTLALMAGGLLLAILAGLVTSIHFALVARKEAADATDARDLADRRANAAAAARLLADQNAARAFDRAYSSDLRLLQQAWGNNQFDYARDLLRRQRPELTDGAERRGFEWHHWDRLDRLRLLTLVGHAGAASCVAFSPDGSILASGGVGSYQDSTWAIKLWDARTAREIRTITGPGRRITGLAFSPDGKRLASTSLDPAGRVWDVATGKPVLTLAGGGKWLQCVAWSRDGKHIAAGSGDFTLRVWDAATGEQRLTLREPGLGVPNCVAFSPDSRLVVAAGDEGDDSKRDHPLLVWDVLDGKKVRTLPCLQRRVLVAAYSPDGKWLASGSKDGRVILWDAGRGEKAHEMAASAGHVSGLAFSPDGRRLVSAGRAEGLKVWDVGTGLQLFGYTGQPGVNGVAWSPDGKRLASCDSDGTTAVWDAEAAARSTILSRDGHVQSLAQSADGARLFAGLSSGRCLVRGPAGEDLGDFGSPPANMSGLAAHPKGTQVVTAGVGLALEVWRPSDGKLLYRELPFKMGLRAAAYHPDGGEAAAVGGDGVVHVLSSGDFKEVRRHRGRGEGHTLAYNRQGSLLALRDAAGVIVWDVSTGKVEAELAGPTRFVGPLAFSPDGRRIACWNHLGDGVIWDLDGGRRLRLTGHSGWVTGLAFSPDGKRLASCSHDRSVKVWDTASGEELLSLAGHLGNFHCVAFSPCGNRLYAGADGGVRVWEGDQKPSGR